MSFRFGRTTCHSDFDDLDEHGHHELSTRGGEVEDEVGLGGRRTSVVFVQATRRVDRDTKIFSNYGTECWFAGASVCHFCLWWRETIPEARS